MSKKKITFLKSMEIPFTCYKYEVETKLYKYRYSLVIIGRHHWFVMNHTTNDEQLIDKRTFDAWKYHDSLGAVIAHHREAVTEERDA